ncbi:peptidase inhibitor family I36 protein [Streptomyces fildesensis]|uniref:Peptidase inhibitor family I36 protein n=1 Tax=Streptomyces fildesensis TaxID=375757 RepID=A0ABW8C549_9ACTN
MRAARTTIATVAALCAFMALAPAASATTGRNTESAGTKAGIELQKEPATSKPVVALYKGKKINLAQSWEGAQACTEVTSGDVYCYASSKEADQALPTIDPSAAAAAAQRKTIRPAGPSRVASPMGSPDCSYPWVCLWENSNYTGRKLQWSTGGTKQLSTWGFRDTASSGCVNRISGGALVYDARDWLPDPYMALGNLGCYDFTTVGYPTGGNWNDKADYIEF